MIKVIASFDGEGSYALRQNGKVILPASGTPPSPPALFLGSLAACAGAFAVRYLQTRGLQFEGLTVSAEADHAEHPHRLGPISIDVQLPAALEPRHMQAIHRAVDLCTLKQTMLCNSPVTCEVTPPRTEPELHPHALH